MSDQGGHVIIGATSAIARAIARRLSTPGSQLVIAGRDPDDLNDLANDLQLRTNGIVIPLKLDVTEFESHPAFVDQCIATLGRIQGIVVCQGYMTDQQTAAEDWAQTQQMIDVNFASAASLINLFAPHLANRRQGFICGISSVAGDRGRQSNYLYGSTKAAFSTYLQGLRNQLFGSGVAVITMKPGYVDTSMTWGRLKSAWPPAASPDRVADDAVRAIRKRKNVVYSPWYWRYIMGVIRVIPEVIFKRLPL
jgi:short-subunit dehydrogenase